MQQIKARVEIGITAIKAINDVLEVPPEEEYALARFDQSSVRKVVATFFSKEQGSPFLPAGPTVSVTYSGGRTERLK